ncbi:MAG TPA: hypothetical protein VGH28_08795 [Polyangiaceae bacterium]|jgi:recombination protein RecA
MNALFGKSIKPASALADQPKAPARSCGWPELDRILPDGGMPHAVVELVCAHETFAGATRVAVTAVRAALERDARAWCAWIDADCTLFAPGLARAGVALDRLLVVRPPRESIARVVVKTASSGAFDILVVEIRRVRGEKLVRKLALAAEQHGTSILILAAPHPDPWPVALRLEIARTRAGLEARVTKDRYGRVQTVSVGRDGLAKVVPIS